MKNNERIIIAIAILISFSAFNVSTNYAAEKPATKTKGTRLTSVPKGYEVKETILSPDKLKTAYILFKKGKKEKKDKFYIFFNGKLSKAYDAVEKTAFSPNSKRFVFCARKGEKEYFVLDGKESSPYDSV